MADIFISYSQKDRDRIKGLVEALTSEGYDVWWDLNIRAGESFDQLIEDTLKQVKCVVAVWSRHSVGSEWERAESAWAKDRGKLVSIRVDADAELPLKFYHVHTQSMAGWDGARSSPAFRELLAHIGAIAGPPPRVAEQVSGKDLPPPEDEPGPAQEVTDAASASSKPDVQPAAGAAPNHPQTQVSSIPGNGSKRRGLVVGAVAIAAAALGGGLFLARAPQEVTPDADAPARVATPDQDKSTPHPAADKAPSEPPPSRPAPLSTFRDTLKDGTQGPEMVVIPAGEFEMGCVSGKSCSKVELPVRTVKFDNPFAVGKYEVTFDEYDAFAEATKRDLPGDQGWGRGRRPVINISWEDAAAYAQWLSEQTGKRYRLPTEAEWELRHPWWHIHALVLWRRQAGPRRVRLVLPERGFQDPSGRRKGSQPLGTV
jgi:hypothetical protein